MDCSPFRGVGGGTDHNYDDQALQAALLLWKRGDRKGSWSLKLRPLPRLAAGWPEGTALVAQTVLSGYGPGWSRQGKGKLLFLLNREKGGFSSLFGGGVRTERGERRGGGSEKAMPPPAPQTSSKACDFTQSCAVVPGEGSNPGCCLAWRAWGRKGPAHPRGHEEKVSRGGVCI